VLSGVRVAAVWCEPHVDKLHDAELMRKGQIGEDHLRTATGGE
jgi:hypothetical protein